MSVLRMAEWQTASGRYMANFPDILLSDKASMAAQIVMDMSTIDFLEYLVDNFNAEIELVKDTEGKIKWYYYWFHSAAECHKHVLEINRIVRKRNLTTELF